MRINVVLILTLLSVFSLALLQGCSCPGINITISPPSSSGVTAPPTTTAGPPATTPPQASQPAETTPPATTPAAMPPPMPPVISQFAAVPDVIIPSQYATLSWLVSDATSVRIDPGIGTFSNLSGSIKVFPPANTLYTLTATGPGGISQAVAQVIVTFSPAEKLPVINAFVATPSTILSGNSSTLSWSVSNASQVEINQGIGIRPAAGSIIVSPINTTTYLLQASNAYGFDQQSVTVKVTYLINPDLLKTLIPQTTIPILPHVPLIEP